MRIAVYFTPPRDHLLTNAAADWLGRDAFTDTPRWRGEVPGFDPGEIEALTADPRRYGFHATMKPPFRIAAGHNLDAIRAALAEFCSTQSVITIPALELTGIGPFFALTAGRADREINALAAEVMRSFESFRAALTEEDMARRRPENLTDRQRANLLEWGYPYVFEDFQFHMTLTGRVPETRRPAMAEVLRRRFAPFIGRPLPIDALTLFREHSPPSDFFVDSRAAFAPVAQAVAGT